ncbi:MAG: YihY/virulence factor BrkB family protein [Akkermansiaceae bacterium]|jgi:YihY family inner membrane protein|nr:YihY/virulence factor BrkB family protein [Akkermansiaceae bacterium]
MTRHTPAMIRFASRVLGDFFLRNHGMLLTGSVAFNVMLSLIPLCTVLVVVFSRLFDRQLLMDSLTAEVSLIAPAFVPTLSDILEGFLDNRGVVGGIGLVTLMFFSSKAFRVLEDAFSIIFHRPLPALKRRFWVSALLPYLFILIVAAGLILVTSANAVIDARVGILKRFPEVRQLVEPYIGPFVYLTGILGLILLFTLLYKIMPVARVSFGRALTGGFTAAVLWEITRHLLVTYYTHIAAVNVIYGSMATLVIVFLTMEAAALILLLGAQVIAELQFNADNGLAWHGDPRNEEPAPH